MAEGYIEESIQNKSKIGGLISSAINSDASNSTSVSTINTENSNSNEPPLKKAKLDESSNDVSILKTDSTYEKISSDEKDSANARKFFNFHNCANITIKYSGI